MKHIALIFRDNKNLLSITIKTFFLSLLLTLSNCGDEPVFIGRNLLPPTDNMLIRTDSITEILAYTVNAKPIITSSNDYYLAGSLNDSIFGYSEASLVGRIEITSPRNIPAGRFIDSLIVEIRIKGYYGDSTSLLKLKVFELVENLKTDTSYFSNTDTEGLFDPVELGSTEFFPNDSLIRFHLTNPEFLHKFAEAEDSIFSLNNYFTDVFKGFYLETDKYTEAGGAFAYLDLKSNDTKITLYYDTDKSDTANLSYLMRFSSQSTTFNVFRSSYDSYPPAIGLNNPLSNDTVLFSTSMAGLDVRIVFPDLEKWRDRSHISIVKAELIIGVEDELYNWKDYTKYPERLILYSLNDKNSYDILYDSRINPELFGGFYNKEKNEYKINISYFLQSYLDKKIEKTEFALVTQNNHSTANRVLLKSPLASGKGRMKLKVIYTE